MKLKQFFLSIMTLVFMYQGISAMSTQAMIEGDTLQTINRWWMMLSLVPLLLTGVVLFLSPKKFENNIFYKGFIILCYFCVATIWWQYSHPSIVEYSRSGDIIVVMVITIWAVVLPQLPKYNQKKKPIKNIFCL